MSSTYTGTPGNVTPGAAVDVTIPADGDALNTASVNVALQEILDYIAFLKRSGYDGTYTTKKLKIDGTGNVANANGDGTLSASGAITSTGGNITADAGNVGATVGNLFWRTGYIIAGTVTTTDATATTIGTYTLSSNKAAYIDVTVIGRKDDTTVNAYRHWTAFCEDGGVSSLMGGGDIHAAHLDDATWGGVTVSGGGSLAVNIQVTGKIATTIAWSVTMIVTNIT